ncbi:alkaline phosphatase family protein [soil metagenome]
MRRKFVGLFLILWVTTASAQDQDRLKVGLQSDGRVVVPTNQVLKPAGKQVTFSGRPVDVAFLEDEKVVVVKNLDRLEFVVLTTGTVRQTLKLPKPAKKADGKIGFGVVGLLVDAGRIYASDGQNRIWIAERKTDGDYAFSEPLALEQPKIGGQADLAGIAKVSDGKLFVTATRGNCVQLLDVAARKVEQVIPVGVAPYMVLMHGTDRAYVSNWGGDHPDPGAPQKTSSGTPVRIDPRVDVANHGSVSVMKKVDGQWKQARSIAVGLHPSGMILSKNANRLYVANANSDSVSVIDTAKDEVIETISCRPQATLPFGSASNALALSPDGGTLYVANGTNNCVAVVTLANRSRDGHDELQQPNSIVAGLIPTGWYPGALALTSDGKRLVVANVKGQGSLSQPRAVEKGHNSHDHRGSISIIDIPNATILKTMTDDVNANNRLSMSLAGLEAPRADAKPVPVPLRHGEPSVFKHVIYIIKENRTYDQVFGDMKAGNGEPKLCIFGEKVTPNHHKLAREFTLLDNFYCSGVLSADGHSWTDSAYVTDYLEKAFGSFSRSYPDDGRDPLAFAPTGFIWDNALKHRKTIRNYGEHVAEEDYQPKGTTWTDYYNDHKNGTRKVPITIKFNNKALEPFTHHTYPYFPLFVPDVYRADLFLEDLKGFERAGAMPNFIIMALPCDHTSGMTPGFPTPRAMVADNDLALGRIIEGVSKSPFWKETCILVVEDDPQDGYDHVDGHRTVALAISPYTKRKAVDSTNYAQTGMVKTIELMLGLPPMNQMDLAATPMRNCFQPMPDFTPYQAEKNQIPLDEMNLSLKKLTGQAKYWAEKSMALNLQQGDKADEDTLNRIIWHATRGFDVPYPEQYARRKVDDDDD